MLSPFRPNPTDPLNPCNPLQSSLPLAAKLWKISGMNWLRPGPGGHCFVAAWIVSLLLASAARADLQSEIRRLAGNDGVVYVVDSANHVLLDVGGQQAFVPASTLKVFTALMAIDHLGLDSRFRTEFFLDHNRLVVKGYGDPFLVSEEIDLIGSELAPQLRGRRLKGIVIDDSYFEPHIQVPGIGGSARVYDAPNSAVAVNFNTINVRLRGGKIVSAEAQTPLTPLAQRLARQRRIRSTLRINLGHRDGETAHYAGELIAAKLREHGVRIGNQVDVGRAPSGPPLYVHPNSRDLNQVLREMLYHSNNYVANQVFLAVGAAVKGAPASLAKSIAVANQYVARHPALKGLVVTEGSGISYDNRATAPAMAALLRLFAPYKDLLRQKHGTPNKTGTLLKVKSVIGYLDTPDHGTVCFVISVDGPQESRRWRVLATLEQWLNQGGA